MSTSSRLSGRTARRVAWLAGAVAVASLIAACGSAGSSQPDTTPSSSSSPSSNPAPTAPSSPTAPATATPTRAASSAPSTGASGGPAPSGGSTLAACRTATLVISVNDKQAGGTAGAAYYPLNFTNTSARACEMYGYPGVSFVTAGSGAGRQIGAAAVRSTAFAKLAVRLGPGSSAHAWLKVTVAANYPAATCDPVTADWLRVYPPEETTAGYVSQTFSACGSASAPLLTILPVRAGKGAAAVTP
jgi:hypothetical protein